jgi:2',3'-cyclic-nucleotide 2'-phosphodiesterase (5'-nucleotidase family)
MRPLVALLWAGCLAACSRAGPLASPRPQPPITITLLHTSDEHGWIEAGETSPGWMCGGAAEIMGLWQTNEGYPSSSTVALTSGDMWTGPAISTWSQGEATVEAMNAMGYQAAALGNHEFDFGQAVLAERRAASKFAFLAANLTGKDGSPTHLAEPFRVLDVSGIRLGIVGLANRATPAFLAEQNTAGLVFGDYARALRQVVPQARSYGADLLVVIAHECAAPLATLAHDVEDLGIPVMLGGHCHAQSSEKVGGTWVVESGQWLNSYSRVDLELDPSTKAVEGVRIRLSKNAWEKTLKPAAPPDRAIGTIVQRWADRANAKLGQVLGHTETGIARPEPMHTLVTRAWLAAFPRADIAISNGGGFRQDLPPGEITVAGILSVLPFENSIVSLNLTGAQVIEDLTCCGEMAVGGIGSVDGRRILTKTGQPMELEKIYRVLVNSFMYSNRTAFPYARQDPHAMDTQIPWREPVIQWLEAQKSSPQRPLEKLIGPAAARY